MYAMIIDAGEEHVTKEQDLKWHVSHPKRGPDTGQLLLPPTFDSLRNTLALLLHHVWLRSCNDSLPGLDREMLIDLLEESC